MLIISKQEFERALIGLSRILPKRTGMPILRCARLQTINPETVVISATNLDESLSCRISVTDAPEGLDTLLPVAELRNFIKGDKRTLLKIEPVDAGGITVTEDIGGQEFTQSFTAPKVDDFPVISECPEPLADLPDDFISTLAKIAPSVSLNDSRSTLHGIALSPAGLTATDGKQLCNVPYPMPITENCILRLPTCLFPANMQGETKIGIFKNNEITLVTIESGNWKWTGRSPYGTYPNWQQIVPKQQDIAWKIELDKPGIPQLNDILQRLPSDDNHNLLRLVIMDGRAELFIEGSTVPTVSCNISSMGGNSIAKTVIVDRKIILRALSLGHNTFEQADGVNAPLVATGGMGKLVFMPWRECIKSATEPVPDKPETTTVEQPKDETMSNEVKTVPVPAVTPEVPVTPEPVKESPTPNSGLKIVPQIDSYDELIFSVEELRVTIRTFNEQTLAIIRKIRDNQANMKRRERDMKAAREMLEKLKVSGF